MPEESDPPHDDGMSSGSRRPAPPVEVDEDKNISLIVIGMLREQSKRQADAMEKAGQTIADELRSFRASMIGVIILAMALNTGIVVGSIWLKFGGIEVGTSQSTAVLPRQESTP